MEGEGEGGGPRLSKRFSDKGGEVEYGTKAGTAWSHNFLNQKPWHPLSYPNQRRKWIAEQTHANRERRADEVAREFAQEQEFFRQTTLVSQKEKEKMEMMKAVSFMYVRPPGYNAESAKAAEIADEVRKEEEGDQQHDEPSTSMPPPSRDQVRQEKKKSVPKDVFGRALPTEEQFEVLKNAPRLETGAPARVKPFAVEVRNVKCLRCGNFGHQSGDRECPLKDAIMPNEENRLKRDDPLTALQAHADSSEPLKWELKQKPGMSPPRGGFHPDDPNQQIVAEDIFDEYGGFLGGEESIPNLLANFTASKLKKKSRSKKKHKRQPSLSGKKSKYLHEEISSSSDDVDGRRRSKKRQQETIKHRETKKHRESSSSSGDERVRSRSKKRNDNRTQHKYSEPSFSSSDYDFGKYRESNDDGERIRSKSKKRLDDRTSHRYYEPDYSLGNGKFHMHRRNDYDDERSAPGSKKRCDNNSTKHRYIEPNHSSRDGEFGKQHKHNDDAERTRSRLKKRSDYKTKHRDSESNSSLEKDAFGKHHEKNDDVDQRTTSRSKKRSENSRKHRYLEPNYSRGDGEFGKHEHHRRNRHIRSYSSDDSVSDERQISKHRHHSHHQEP